MIRSHAYTERCLSGKELYGDCFRPKEIQAWFEEEREAYFNTLNSKGFARVQSNPKITLRKGYAYHELNWRHGIRYLPPAKGIKVLGFGSSYGLEFLPIIKLIASIDIIEPCNEFHVFDDIEGVPVQYHMLTSVVK